MDRVDEFWRERAGIQDLSAPREPTLVTITSPSGYGWSAWWII
jgi:hypothetical protein